MTSLSGVEKSIDGDDQRIVHSVQTVCIHNNVSVEINSKRQCVNTIKQ